MITKKNSIVLAIILLLLSLALFAAFIIEYGFGNKPCKLCIYQRYPYAVSIILILSTLLLKRYIKIHLLILSLVSLIGGTIAFYHFSIEQGFFSESAICETKNINQFLSKEYLLKELEKGNISCKDVTFRLFGLSLASINTIFSFILSYIFFSLFKNYEKNR